MPRKNLSQSSITDEYYSQDHQFYTFFINPKNFYKFIYNADLDLEKAKSDAWEEYQSHIDEYADRIPTKPGSSFALFWVSTNMTSMSKASEYWSDYEERSKWDELNEIRMDEWRKFCHIHSYSEEVTTMSHASSSGREFKEFRDKWFNYLRINTSLSKEECYHIIGNAYNNPDDEDNEYLHNLSSAASHGGAAGGGGGGSKKKKHSRKHAPDSMSVFY